MKFYDCSGNSCTEEEACLKVGPTCYAKEFRGELYDPKGMFSHKFSQTTWRKISNKCAEYYLVFLTNSSTTHYRWAEREFTNV